jgi:selenide, water dikinase
LDQILDRLPSTRASGSVLVGTEHSDDAGVIRLDDERALVLTVDLITPVSDDPYLFGQVAAANSLSDIYAMGGRVLAALNVCCFPESLPRDVMIEILRGGADKVAEAGGRVVGGHSVEDEDLKFGLSVTGEVHPDAILRNGGALPGDLLVLTKPLGTGVGISAEKMALMQPQHRGRLGRELARLNANAARLGLQAGARCATDVTGFGLAGHGLEMARASGARLRFDFARLPSYSWFEHYWAAGARTKVTAANRELVGDRLVPSGPLREVDFDLICDPQTSGGLLMAVPAEGAEELAERLAEGGDEYARVVGEVVAGEPAVEVVAEG